MRADVKKILIIDPYEDIIGPHQVAKRIIESFIGGQWSFLVVVPSQGETYRDYEEIGVNVRVLPGLKPIRRILSIRYFLKSIVDFFRVGYAIILLVKKEKIEIIHSITAACLVGGFVARFVKKPSVIHVHDLTLNQDPLSGSLLGLVLVATTDKIICVSEVVKQNLPLRQILSDKAEVIYNAVDIKKYSPKPLVRKQYREKLCINEDEILAGVFGVLDRRKGQDIFLNVANQLYTEARNLRFLIVGGYSPIALSDGFSIEIEKLSKPLLLNNRLIILGRRNDVADLLQAVDMVVQTSRIDAGPIVPLEAMATGKPVIATNVGANSEEIINGYSGVIVSLNDEQAMADAILALRNDKSLREKLGQQGRKLVIDRFDLQQQAEKMASIYRSLI